MLKLVIIAALVAVLAGCGSTHQVDRYTMTEAFVDHANALDVVACKINAHAIYGTPYTLAVCRVP
jgi:hypothetical protein